MKFEQQQLQLPLTEYKLVKVGEETCAKCRGRGEIDMTVCHGFGAQSNFWDCSACKGSGKTDKLEFAFV